MIRLADFVGDGLCAQTDPELFFRERTNQWDGHLDKKICKGCEVIEVCREWAIENPSELGTWGGTSFDERVKIRRERRLAS